MNSSAALLSILLSLGLGLVGVLWGLKERNTARGDVASGVESIQRQADADITSIQADLDEVNTKHALLEDEVRALRRKFALEQENLAEALRVRDRLEARLASHMAGGSKGVDGRDWSDEEIDLRGRTEELTVAIRELHLTGPLGYRFTDWEGMRAALGGSAAVVPEAEASAQSRAFAAMGFVSPETDVRARMLDLLEGQLGAALYAGEGTVLFNAEGSTKSVHDRTALAVEVVRAIQDQHFKVLETLGQWAHNDDARLALWSAAAGDSNLVKIRFQLQDTTAAADELLQSPTKMTREQFERIPAFLREYYLFPFALGDRFCQKLHELKRWAGVNKGLSRPPTSTAEILHPELFTADTVFEPERFRWPVDGLAVDEVVPIWNNVAGELGIALMFNQSDFLQRMKELGQPDVLDMPELVSKGYEHFSERAGSKAAAGWAGDRYLVYPNGDGADGGDQVFWLSKWSSPEDAEEFYQAARKSLAFRREVEFADGDEWATGRGRFVTVRKIGEDRVCVIDVAEKAFGEALWEKFKVEPEGVE